MNKRQSKQFVWSWIFAGATYVGAMLGAAMASGQLSNGLLDRLGLLDAPKATPMSLIEAPIPTAPAATPAAAIAQQAGSHAERRLVVALSNPIGSSLPAVRAMRMPVAPAVQQANQTVPRSPFTTADAPWAESSILISPTDGETRVLPPEPSAAVLTNGPFTQFADAGWRTPRIDRHWSDGAVEPWPAMDTDVGREPLDTPALADAAPLPIASDGFTGDGFETNLPYETVVDTGGIDIGGTQLIPPGNELLVPEPTTAVGVVVLLSFVMRRSRREQV